MDREKYYRIPEKYQVERISLTEKPGEAIRLEQPSGQLTITFFGKDRKFPHAVTSLPDENTLVLIASGQGKIQKDNQEFNLTGTPAVFLVDSQHPIQTKGDFSGWIVRLKETTLTPNLPTTQTNIDHWIPQEGEMIKTIQNDKFPRANGRIVRWCMGQWNSTSPINIAYEGGGLASVGDSKFDIEEQISEIHLALQGRIIFDTVANPTLDGGGNLMVDEFKTPIRSGDIIIAKPGSHLRMGRYSGDYKGFCLKWADNPADIIDTKRKREIEIKT